MVKVRRCHGTRSSLFPICISDKYTYTFTNVYLNYSQLTFAFVFKNEILFTVIRLYIIDPMTNNSPGIKTHPIP